MIFSRKAPSIKDVPQARVGVASIQNIIEFMATPALLVGRTGLAQRMPLRIFSQGLTTAEGGVYLTHGSGDAVLNMLPDARKALATVIVVEADTPVSVLEDLLWAFNNNSILIVEWRLAIEHPKSTEFGQKLMWFLNEFSLNRIDNEADQSVEEASLGSSFMLVFDRGFERLVNWMLLDRGAQMMHLASSGFKILVHVESYVGWAFDSHLEPLPHRLTTFSNVIVASSDDDSKMALATRFPQAAQCLEDLPSNEYAVINAKSNVYVGE